MWDVFTTVSNNVGIEFELIILMLVFFGGMIFYAKGFQVGISVQTILTGGVFIWFYNSGLHYQWPLYLFITLFVVMALSLYFMASTRPSGGLT